MPNWLYQTQSLYVALILVSAIEMVSMIGLFLARRFVIPHLKYHEGANDAVSGTVQAIGVFYGITVGLIAVAVWNTNSTASDLVSTEASAIGGLYRDVGGYPSPVKEELRIKLRDYTDYVIQQDWASQKNGRTLDGGANILSDFQMKLFAFEPTTPGQTELHAEALRAFNHLADCRRLRVVAAGAGLSSAMWAVIWVGAVITIGVAYFFKIPDGKLHAVLVGLIAGFLAMVLFMIVINDKPFYGYVSVSPDPYQIMLDRMTIGAK
jgi:hypothetical protein